MASHRIPFDSLSAAERSRLIAENDRLRQQLRDRYREADLAGTSRAIRHVRELIAQVASSTAVVCLRGEEGVGKARAARAIHGASPRASSPFVALSCATMPDGDVDAQLAGLERREERGAGISPVSAIGRASGGTLSFHDIADLGPLAQRRLLHLVRDGAWTRADGSRLRVDVRVIVATSRALDAAVALGTFRRDLWSMLEAHTIVMAPLRERREDLPVLTDLFVEQVAREHVRAVSRVSAKAVDMLMNYEWPGNVSQLRRTIERAVVLTTGPIIHHHHLPAEIQQSGGTAGPLLGLTEALDGYEKELLQDALRQAHGVRSRAARLLMTSERVLSYRLRKHRIDSRRFKAS